MAEPVPAADADKVTHYEFEDEIIIGTPPSRLVCEAAVLAPPVVSASKTDFYQDVLNTGGLLHPAATSGSPSASPLSSSPLSGADAKLLDDITYVAQAGTAPGLPHLLASLIQEWDQTDIGLRRLAQHLADRNALQDFYDFARSDISWDAMRSRGLDYDILLETTVRYGIGDSVRFMTGILAGAGWSIGSLPFVVYEAVEALAGSAFDGTLADDAAKLAQFVKGLLTNPEVSGQLLAGWLDELARHMARRQWERAGFAIGEILLDVIAIAKGAVKVAGKGGRVLAQTYKTLDRLPDVGPSEVLREMAPSDAEQLVNVAKDHANIAPTSSGAVQRVGENLVVQGADGKPITKSLIDDDFLSEVDARLDEMAAAPGIATTEAFARSLSALKGLVLDADRIASLVRTTVPTGSTPQVLGTNRHTAAFKLLQQATSKYPWIQHYTKTKLSSIPGFSPEIANMTVKDYFLSRGLDLELLGPQGGYPVNRNGLIGDLELDHASIDPATKLAVIWDLTGQPKPSGRHERHLAKTTLYANALVDGLGDENVGMVNVVEAYHIPEKIPKDPYP